ncbi:MAG: SDR family NAD(P)-dependent oxidoreductase [Candidatus Methylumidiphilus sp.]
MSETQLPEQTAEALKKTLLALRRAQARVAELEARRGEPVAVVGIACRLPGGANDPGALWDLLRRGEDSCGPVPPERWPSERFYNPSADAPGQTHAASANFLDVPVGGFDAPFFGISAKEALSLDPQQRLLLETTWEALEDAGIDPASLRGSRTGVFTGISSDDYAQAHRHSGRLDLIDGYALTGTCFAPAAGRVSYTFGFEGPSIAVDTACSSSLVAVHLACQSLRAGETDLAFAAGVNLILSPVFHISSSKLGTISPDGLCKTFDASANGYGRGEGCGVVALKRLSDAQAQGDRILGVIRGSAVNQDGKSNGLTAPNGLAQEKVIREALARAGLAPGDIGYIEVHGTGTSLGDPIEVEAIGRVMQGRRPAEDPVILSTVKTNIGHLEAAAGIAGLIKAILCLRHGEIPAHLHLNDPNPHIPWGEYPFKVVTAATPWPAPATAPRRAGISSFGFSGTNAHVIVEEPPAQTSIPEEAEGPFLLPLSARTEEALRALTDNWVAWLEAPGASLADGCFTAGAGRTHFTHRLAAVGQTPADMASALRSHLDGKPSRALAVGATGRRPKIAALFTGQGSQYVGMGAELYRREPVFRAAIDECDAALRDVLGRSMRDAFQGEGANEDALRQTGLAQPAIFAIEVALYRLWQSWGVLPDIVCGHSIGEYAAAHVAGILTLADALALVAERGRLMQQAPASGAMAAVFANEAVVEALLRPGDGVCIAAVNTPNESVVSGPGPAVADLLARLAAAGLSAQPLKVSHAFHSPLMRPIVPAFEAAAASCAYAPALLPVVSTVTGRKAAPDEMANPRYWAGQIEAPVRFAAAVETLAGEGVEVFLEIGPAPILAGLARQCLAADGHLFLGSLAKSGVGERQQMLESLAKLYARGADADWAAVGRSSGGRKTAVPGYPFQRKDYYMAPIVDAGGSIAPATLPGAAHAYLGQRLRSPALPASTVLYQTVFEADRPAFLKEHQIFGKIISPAAAHLSMAFAAGGEGRAVEDVGFTAPLVVEPGKPRLVQLAVESDGAGGQVYRLMSHAAEESAAPWTTHSTGRVAAAAEPPPSADLSALRARCQGGMSPTEFYALIETLGYSTGPDFQCIREIRKGENESVCLVEAARAIDDGAIHPGLIDSLLQTVLPACEGYIAQALADGSVLIPLHMASVRLSGSLDQPLHCHTRVEAAGDLVKAQITAYGADGAPLADIRDFLLKGTERTTLYQDLRQDDDSLIHSIVWRPLATAAPVTLPAEAGWVVFADAGGWGEAIAAHLREQGAECLALAQRAPTASGLDFIDTSGTGAVRAALLPRLAGLRPHRVNLLFTWHGAGEDPATDCREAAESLLHLVQAIGASELRDRLRLWLLTRQAQPVVREDQAIPPPSLEGSLLWGLGRAIAQEMPDIWGGLVDLEARPSATGAAALVGLIGASTSEDQVALRRGQQVFAARLVAATEATAATRKTPRLGEGECYALEKGARRTLDDLGFVTRRRRVPTAAEVEVEVIAAGLNFRDVLNALGQYPGEAGPLGFEAVGRVVAVGEAVSDLAVGEEVILLGAAGCIASHVTLPRIQVVRKPASLGVAEAVSLPATFLTAYYALHHLGKMQRGDRVLIHAAAGGVGLAAVQLALAAGAEVFATAGAPEKHAYLAAMGVAHVMSSRNTEFAGQIRSLTGGAGVDIVLNSLSGDFIPASFSVLAEGGRFLEMGKIGIWDKARVHAENPTWFYQPFDLAAVLQEDPALVIGMFDAVLAGIAAGQLSPLPVSVFPMAEAEEAFRFMAQARHIGKIVLSRTDERRRAAADAFGPVRADAAYLVTGGLGALGLRVAHWLASEGAKRLVLTGRRAPGAEALAEIAELERQGAEVLVVQGDVADLTDARRAVAAAGPALAGVIHAAGVLDDAMIADIDTAKLRRVMAPKVSGAWNLHLAARQIDLDFFVLFSSVAAIIGNLGQASYAGANAFMDGLAAYRRSLSLPATSINWGPWAETGMAATLEVDRFAAQGIRSLSPAQGIRSLSRLLTESPLQAVVADVDWPTYGASHGMDGKSGLFAALVADSSQAQAQTSGTAARDIVAELQAILPVERESRLSLYLQDLVRQTLGYGENEPIATDQPLVAQGFDSLMSVDMRNRLNRSVGRTLPASLLFDYPTVDKIVRHLLESVLQFDDAPVAAAPTASAEQLLEELEKLIG